MLSGRKLRDSPISQQRGLPHTGYFSRPWRSPVKFRSLPFLLTIAISISLTNPVPSSAAGRSATSIPNTILNGKGAPTLSTGINGDFYIDTRSLLIYGPKKNGKWPAPQNLQGPTGAAGANGADGKNGNDGKNRSLS